MSYTAILLMASCCIDLFAWSTQTKYSQGSVAGLGSIASALGFDSNHYCRTILISMARFCTRQDMLANLSCTNRLAIKRASARQPIRIKALIGGPIIAAHLWDGLVIHPHIELAISDFLLPRDGRRRLDNGRVEHVLRVGARVCEPLRSTI